MGPLADRLRSPAAALPLAGARVRRLGRAAAHVALGALLSLTAAAQPDDPLATATAWLTATDPPTRLDGLATTLAELPEAHRSTYLEAAIESLAYGRPATLSAAERRRAFGAHVALLDRADAGAAVRFCTYFALYLTQGGSPDGALDALRYAGSRSQGQPQADDLAYHRAALRVDCLLLLERPIAADAALADASAYATARDARAQHLAQSGSVHTMLGRLDRAGRALDEARALLDERIGEAGPGEVARFEAVRFEVERRRLDLFNARERYDLVRTAIAELAATRAAAGRPLTEAERRKLRVHELAADYFATQASPATAAATAAALADALAGSNLQPRERTLLQTCLADLRVDEGRLDDAASLLREVEAGAPSRRVRWLVAPIASRLARARGDVDAQRRRRDALAAVLDEMIDEWRRAPLEGDSTGFLRLGSRLRVLGELVEATVALDGPEAAFAPVLDVHGCTRLCRARDAAAIDLAGLRSQLLGADGGALVIVPAWHRSHVFAVDAQTVVHAPAPRAHELRRATAALRRELSALDDGAPDDDPQLAAVRERSRALADLLLPPSVRARLLTWRHAHAAGAGLLGGLPLQCLELDDGALLGERVAASTTSSLPLSASLALARTAPPERADAVLVATLSPGPAFAARNGIGPAPQADDTWRALRAALPGEVRALLDGDAHVDALRAALQRRPDLTVLLLHGEAGVGEAPPALGLAPHGIDDGELDVEELRRLHLGPVVVLAACSAARGPRRMGEDATDGTLAGACLRAGSDAVVASAVPQRLGLFAPLVAALGEQLAAGAPLAEALLRARRAVGDRRARAYRAAQVEVYGDGQRVVAPPPASRTWPLLAATALVIAAGCCAAWRFRRPGPRSAAPASSRSAAAGS